MRLSFVCTVFLLVMVVGGGGAQLSPQAVQQEAPDEALQLLGKVAQHYSEAESVHLEERVDTVTHIGDQYQMSESETLSVYQSPGERFRYYGKNSRGSELIVSDGTNEWRLLGSFGQYSKQPAGTFFSRPNTQQGDDGTIGYAPHIVDDLTFVAGTLQSAHFAEPETLVVHYGYADSSDRRDQLQAANGDRSETIMWIDPVSLTILKREFRGHSHLNYSYGPTIPAYAPVMDSVKTTTFTVADLDFKPNDDTYTFVPPSGSREVAELPKPPALTASTRLTPLISPEMKSKEARIEKPLPAAYLQDVDGKQVPLSRYVGHPLLIDVWATWCGPCMLEMPALARIRKSTTGTDLQILGVDQDLKMADSIAFLKRRGYDWPDLHYTNDFVKQMSMHGVPLTVLVDASGKVVYYHTGGDDAKGLAEAITKLGPAYESARAE